MTAFKKGDRVAWSHAEATKHSPGSVVYASAIPVGDPSEPGTGQRGTVVEAGNDVGSVWEVDLDDGRTIGLTSDELVKIDEDGA